MNEGQKGTTEKRMRATGMKNDETPEEKNTKRVKFWGCRRLVTQ